MTTNDRVTQMAAEEDKPNFVRVVVILPSGNKQTIHIHGKVPNDYTVSELLHEVHAQNPEADKIMGDFTDKIIHMRF